jgi:hypothetical protein
MIAIARFCDPGATTGVTFFCHPPGDRKRIGLAEGDQGEEKGGSNFRTETLHLAKRFIPREIESASPNPATMVAYRPTWPMAVIML